MPDVIVPVAAGAGTLQAAILANGHGIGPSDRMIYEMAPGAYTEAMPSAPGTRDVTWCVFRAAVPGTVTVTWTNQGGWELSGASDTEWEAGVEYIRLCPSPWSSCFRIRGACARLTWASECSTPPGGGGQGYMLRIEAALTASSWAATSDGWDPQLGTTYGIYMSAPVVAQVDVSGAQFFSLTIGMQIWTGAVITGDGGVMYACEKAIDRIDGTLDLVNYAFIDCTKGAAGGASALSFGAVVGACRFRHCCFADFTRELMNNASANPAISFENSIIAAIAGGATLHASDTLDDTCRFLCVRAGGTETNPILADPLFVGGGDYHLQAGSPCRNACPDVGVYTDLDGNTRPMGSGFDAGTYEYVEHLIEGTRDVRDVRYARDMRPMPGGRMA